MPRSRTIKERASLLTVLLLIAIAITVIALLLPSHKQRPSGTLAFALLDGRTITLQALRGRPVLVDFWATSCRPCVEETPALIRLYQELKPKGVEFIAVAMPYDPPFNVQTFAQQHLLPYPIAIDVAGNATRAFDGVDVVPTAFILDAHGVVVYRHSGKLDIARVRRIISTLLNDART